MRDINYNKTHANADDATNATLINEDLIDESLLDNNSYKKRNRNDQIYYMVLLQSIIIETQITLMLTEWMNCKIQQDQDTVERARVDEINEFFRSLSELSLVNDNMVKLSVEQLKLLNDLKERVKYFQSILEQRISYITKDIVTIESKIRDLQEKKNNLADKNTRLISSILNEYASSSSFRAIIIPTNINNNNRVIIDNATFAAICANISSNKAGDLEEKIKCAIEKCIRNQLHIRDEKEINRITSILVERFNDIIRGSDKHQEIRQNAALIHGLSVEIDRNLAELQIMKHRVNRLQNIYKSHTTISDTITNAQKSGFCNSDVIKLLSSEASISLSNEIFRLSDSTLDIDFNKKDSLSLAESSQNNVELDDESRAGFRMK